MIKLVLFDFDGTLVDTAEDIVISLQKTLKIFELPMLSKDEIIASIGDGFKGLVKGYLPSVDESSSLFEDMRRNFLEDYYNNFLNNPRIYEGATDFLEQWSGKVGILSNKHEEHIPPLLDKLKMNQYPWECIIGGNTYVQSKPHPLPMEKACEIANVQPHEVLLDGDGIPDIGVAKASGSHFVAVDFGYSSKEVLTNNGAENFISHHNELLRYIDNLNASC